MEVELAESLRKAPLFAGLSAPEVEEVLAIGEHVRFEAGEPIVRQGEPGDAMFVVVSGTAEVDVGGRFHSLGPGSFFGEMALLTSRARIATVKAAGEAEAVRIPSEAFRAFLLGHPAVAVAMLRSIVERLREVEERIDAWMGTG